MLQFCDCYIHQSLIINYGDQQKHDRDNNNYNMDVLTTELNQNEHFIQIIMILKYFQ